MVTLIFKGHVSLFFVNLIWRKFLQGICCMILWIVHVLYKGLFYKMHVHMNSRCAWCSSVNYWSVVCHEIFLFTKFNNRLYHKEILNQIWTFRQGRCFFRMWLTLNLWLLSWSSRRTLIVNVWCVVTSTVTKTFSALITSRKVSLKICDYGMDLARTAAVPPRTAQVWRSPVRNRRNYSEWTSQQPGAYVSFLPPWQVLVWKLN